MAEETTPAGRKKAVRERCGSCGKRIRGPGHDEGQHHRRVQIRKK